jgi:hypothetical protein
VTPCFGSDLPCSFGPRVQRERWANQSIAFPSN